MHALHPTYGDGKHYFFCLLLACVLLLGKKVEAKDLVTYRYPCPSGVPIVFKVHSVRVSTLCKILNSLLIGLCVLSILSWVS